MVAMIVLFAEKCECLAEKNSAIFIPIFVPWVMKKISNVYFLTFSIFITKRQKNISECTVNIPPQRR